MTHDRFVDAYEDVRTAGASVGLAAPAVEAEAAAIAAGVCAESPDAAIAWANVFNRRVGVFAEAAKDGKQLDRQATPLLARLVDEGRDDDARLYGTALAGLAIESCSLDPDPTLACINTAGLIARRQLAAGNSMMSAIDLASSHSSPTGSAVAVVPSAPKKATARETAKGDAADGGTPKEAPPPTLAELLAKLDALIGLTAVKDQVHRQVALLRVNQLRVAKGLKSSEVSRHLVFVGNPGTGKTTVARLVAGIYRALGILTKGTLVETDRSGLVAGYLGQTAIKTADIIKQAIGCVLFIDEAYALAAEDDQYGDEAVATLVKAMEDFRDSLVVIVAGYPVEMQEFIDSNPGLESRFATTISFPDYSEDELVAIFELQCRDADFTPTPECIEKLRELLRAEPRDKGFGNGRLVRNLFEAAMARQAWRLRSIDAPSVEQLRCLEVADLPETTSGG